MSSITYQKATNPPPSIGSLGRDDRHSGNRSAGPALKYLYVPAALSLACNWVFFIVYWIPELGSFPGHSFVLGQLAPMVSKELTSQSQGIVPQQGGHTGLLAAVVLVASLALVPLGLARYWLARLVIWPVVYLAAICAAVIVIGVLVRGQLGTEFLGVALLVVWVGTAMVTTWRSLWVNIDTLPRRRPSLLWPLGAYVLLNPAPVALGRRIFAPELREAATEVLRDGLTLRWAALFTPATALLYLSGVGVGVLVWSLYLLWPPRQPKHTIMAVVGLVLSVLCCVVIGPQAGRLGAERAEAIRTESPRADVGYTCGAWTHTRSGNAVETLVVTGLTCRRLTSFIGYRQTRTQEAPGSLSPVDVQTMTGEPIPGRLVAAEYDDVVAVAVTSRVNNTATEMLGLRIGDATTVWRFGCPGGRAFKLRFAGVPEGDDAKLGRVTEAGETAMVVIDCGTGPVRIDPRTGKVQ